MPKKDLRLAFWGQIIRVFDKFSPHSNKASSSSCSTYSGSTTTTAVHGRTMDQSQPHHKQQQEHYSTPQEQQLSSRQEQQQRRKQIPHQQLQPLSSPHGQQIYTPYRHVYYSSTLSLKVRTSSSSSFSSSCTSLSSTLSSSSLTPVQDSEDSQYESLWEVQLALREIPGMIEGNILESCQREDSTAGTGAASMSSGLLSPPLPLQQQPQFQLLSSSIAADTQPQATISSLRRTFATMEEFPHFPSPSASDDDGNIDNDYYSESGDDNVEEDDDEGAVEDLAFQPFSQQLPQPHPLLQLYSAPYCSANNYNTRPSFLSIEPHLSQNDGEEDEEEEGEIALAHSRRQFRGNNDNSATLLNGDANDVPFANASNNPSFSSNPRSDRKDSGVFIHDAEDGTIVKISPRAMFPFSSSSASESESESEAEPSDYSY